MWSLSQPEELRGRDEAAFTELRLEYHQKLGEELLGAFAEKRGKFISFFNEHVQMLNPWSLDFLCSQRGNCPLQSGNYNRQFPLGCLPMRAWCSASPVGCEPEMKDLAE